MVHHRAQGPTRGCWRESAAVPGGLPWVTGWSLLSRPGTSWWSPVEVCKAPVVPMGFGGGRLPPRARALQVSPAGGVLKHHGHTRGRQRWCAKVSGGPTSIASRGEPPRPGSHQGSLAGVCRGAQGSPVRIRRHAWNPPGVSRGGVPRRSETHRGSPVGVCLGAWGPTGGCQLGSVAVPGDLPGVVGKGVPRHPRACQGMPAGVCCCAWEPTGGHQRQCTEAPRDLLGVAGGGALPCQGGPQGVAGGGMPRSLGDRQVSQAGVCDAPSYLQGVAASGSQLPCPVSHRGSLAGSAAMPRDPPRLTGGGVPRRPGAHWGSSAGVHQSA